MSITLDSRKYVASTALLFPRFTPCFTNSADGDDATGIGRPLLLLQCSFALVELLRRFAACSRSGEMAIVGKGLLPVIHRSLHEGQETEETGVKR